MSFTSSYLITGIKTSLKYNQLFFYCKGNTILLDSDTEYKLDLSSIITKVKDELGVTSISGNRSDFRCIGDGKFLIHYEFTISGNSTSYLICVDTSSNILWYRKYGLTSDNDIFITKNKKYIVDCCNDSILILSLEDGATINTIIQCWDSGDVSYDQDPITWDILVRPDFEHVKKIIVI